MRVRGLRAAQPSPARSVTQSRRLAGACAEFQGLLWGGEPGTVCWVQPALHLLMPGLG